MGLFSLDWAETQAILFSWIGSILEHLYFSLKAGERPSDDTTFPGIQSLMAALLINLCVISGSFLRGLINMCESLIITTPQHFQQHFSSETAFPKYFKPLPRLCPQRVRILHGIVVAAFLPLSGAVSLMSHSGFNSSQFLLIPLLKIHFWPVLHQNHFGWRLPGGSASIRVSKVFCKNTLWSCFQAFDVFTAKTAWESYIIPHITLLHHLRIGFQKFGVVFSQ